MSSILAENNDLVVNENTALNQDVQRYWTHRAAEYSHINATELANAKRARWLKKIMEYAPDAPLLRVLDIGTGPGFFAVALAGHRVTAVDMTEAMLTEARANAAHYAVHVDFVSADVHAMPLADNQFDLIVTRNVTWNLAEPLRAYREWRRLLAPGGRLLNFDANWYLQLFDESSRLGYLDDRANARYLGLEDHYVNTDITNRLKNDYNRCPDMRQKSIAGCYQNNVGWLYGWDKMSGKDIKGEKIWFQPQDSRFFEYHSTGAGAEKNDGRRQLTVEQTAEYTKDKVLAGWTLTAP
ncbi:methyltransferase domain-containing protein [Symbiopectobacterium sp. RP]|uniref:class I SAM-dependent methyltransferase n=1 Tax=Symbiopectobacterium sp. RP TaxID=3248553 RepID=UPI003D2DCC8C